MDSCHFKRESGMEAVMPKDSCSRNLQRPSFPTVANSSLYSRVLIFGMLTSAFLPATVHAQLVIDLNDPPAWASRWDSLPGLQSWAGTFLSALVADEEFESSDYGRSTKQHALDEFVPTTGFEGHEAWSVDAFLSFRDNMSSIVEDASKTSADGSVPVGIFDTLKHDLSLSKTFIRKTVTGKSRGFARGGGQKNSDKDNNSGSWANWGSSLFFQRQDNDANIDLDNEPTAADETTGDDSDNGVDWGFLGDSFWDSFHDRPLALGFHVALDFSVDEQQQPVPKIHKHLVVDVGGCQHLGSIESSSAMVEKRGQKSVSDSEEVGPLNPFPFDIDGEEVSTVWRQEPIVPENVTTFTEQGTLQTCARVCHQAVVRIVDHWKRQNELDIPNKMVIFTSDPLNECTAAHFANTNQLFFDIPVPPASVEHIAESVTNEELGNPTSPWSYPPNLAAMDQSSTWYNRDIAIVVGQTLSLTDSPSHGQEGEDQSLVAARSTTPMCAYEGIEEALDFIGLNLEQRMSLRRPAVDDTKSDSPTSESGGNLYSLFFRENPAPESSEKSEGAPQGRLDSESECEWVLEHLPLEVYIRVFEHLMSAPPNPVWPTVLSVLHANILETASASPTPASPESANVDSFQNDPLSVTCSNWYLNADNVRSQPIIPGLTDETQEEGQEIDGARRNSKNLFSLLNLALKIASVNPYSQSSGPSSSSSSTTSSNEAHSLSTRTSFVPSSIGDHHYSLISSLCQSCHPLGNLSYAALHDAFKNIRVGPCRPNSLFGGRGLRLQQLLKLPAVTPFKKAEAQQGSKKGFGLPFVGLKFGMRGEVSEDGKEQGVDENEIVWRGEIESVQKAYHELWQKHQESGGTSSANRRMSGFRAARKETATSSFGDSYLDSESGIYYITGYPVQLPENEVRVPPSITDPNEDGGATKEENPGSFGFLSQLWGGGNEGGTKDAIADVPQVVVPSRIAAFFTSCCDYNNDTVDLGNGKQGKESGANTIPQGKVMKFAIQVPLTELPPSSTQALRELVVPGGVGSSSTSSSTSPQQTRVSRAARNPGHGDVVVTKAAGKAVVSMSEFSKQYGSPHSEGHEAAGAEGLSGLMGSFPVEIEIRVVERGVTNNQEGAEDEDGSMIWWVDLKLPIDNHVNVWGVVDVLVTLDEDTHTLLSMPFTTALSSKLIIGHVPYIHSLMPYQSVPASPSSPISPSSSLSTPLQVLARAILQAATQSKKNVTVSVEGSSALKSRMDLVGVLRSVSPLRISDGIEVPMRWHVVTYDIHGYSALAPYKRETLAHLIPQSGLTILQSAQYLTSEHTTTTDKSKHNNNLHTQSLAHILPAALEPYFAVTVSCDDAKESASAAGTRVVYRVDVFEVLEGCVLSERRAGMAGQANAWIEKVRERLAPGVRIPTVTLMRHRESGLKFFVVDVFWMSASSQGSGSLPKESAFLLHSLEYLRLAHGYPVVVTGAFPTGMQSGFSEVVDKMLSVTGLWRSYFPPPQSASPPTDLLPISNIWIPTVAPESVVQALSTLMNFDDVQAEQKPTALPTTATNSTTDNAPGIPFVKLQNVGPESSCLLGECKTRPVRLNVDATEAERQVSEGGANDRNSSAVFALKKFSKWLRSPDAWEGSQSMGVFDPRRMPARHAQCAAGVVKGGHVPVTYEIELGSHRYRLVTFNIGHLDSRRLSRIAKASSALFQKRQKCLADRRHEKDRKTDTAEETSTSCNPDANDARDYSEGYLADYLSSFDIVLLQGQKGNIALSDRVAAVLDDAASRRRKWVWQKNQLKKGCGDKVAADTQKGAECGAEEPMLKRKWVYRHTGIEAGDVQIYWRGEPVKGRARREAIPSEADEKAGEEKESGGWFSSLFGFGAGNAEEKKKDEVEVEDALEYVVEDRNDDTASDGDGHEEHERYDWVNEFDDNREAESLAIKSKLEAIRCTAESYSTSPQSSSPYPSDDTAKQEYLLGCVFSSVSKQNDASHPSGSTNPTEGKPTKTHFLVANVHDRDHDYPLSNPNVDLPHESAGVMKRLYQTLCADVKGVGDCVKYPFPAMFAGTWNTRHIRDQANQTYEAFTERLRGVEQAILRKNQIGDAGFPKSYNPDLSIHAVLPPETAQPSHSSSPSGYIPSYHVGSYLIVQSGAGSEDVGSVVGGTRNGDAEEEEEKLGGVENETGGIFGGSGLLGWLLGSQGNAASKHTKTQWPYWTAPSGHVLDYLILWESSQTPTTVPQDRARIDFFMSSPKCSTLRRKAENGNRDGKWLLTEAAGACRATDIPCSFVGSSPFAPVGLYLGVE
ncbi:hypothetical protein HK102_013599, partial [Quaeritorhiza haematococci]